MFIPECVKAATFIPVLKRPTGLESQQLLIMKCLEWLVMGSIKFSLSISLDPSSGLILCLTHHPDTRECPDAVHGL